MICRFYGVLGVYIKSYKSVTVRLPKCGKQQLFLHHWALPKEFLEHMLCNKTPQGTQEHVSLAFMGGACLARTMGAQISSRTSKYVVAVPKALRVP